MEKKYNSLKEALPSLLEEKARLEEECHDIRSEYSEFYMSLGADEYSRTHISIVFNMLREKLSFELISKVTGYYSHYIKELANNSFINYVEIKSKEDELEDSISRLSDLIKAIEDISLIADTDFKAKFKNHQHLFSVAFNDILATNNLAWIYKFSKNNNGLLNSNISALIEKVIKTNIPAYMYLVAVKINNIPDEEMKHLIVAIVASNDKKYIDYLLLTLSNKSLSREVKEFILTLNISISANNFINYDNTLADRLEKALLEGDDKALTELGISCEDGVFVLTKR